MFNVPATNDTLLTQSER